MLFFGRTPYLLLHCTKHRHVHETMLVTPRAPRQVSLAQLLACGLIEESEVHINGHVNALHMVCAANSFTLGVQISRHFAQFANLVRKGLHMQLVRIFVENR